MRKSPSIHHDSPKSGIELEGSSWCPLSSFSLCFGGGGGGGGLMTVEAPEGGEEVEEDTIAPLGTRNSLTPVLKMIAADFIFTVLTHQRVREKNVIKISLIIALGRVLWLLRILRFGFGTDDGEETIKKIPHT